MANIISIICRVKKNNLIKYTGPLTRQKKGGIKHISWRTVAAIIGAEMAVRHRDSILEEENLRFEESIIEGTCEEVK